MSKNKFKNGVRAVAGEPGKWDVNFQVEGKRVTKRIEAKNYEEALSWRLAQKSSLRKKNEAITNGEQVFELNEVFNLLMEKIKNQVVLGEVDRKTISEISTRFQRFFFDYPKHLGVEWKTTADFTAKDFDNYRNYYGIFLNRKQGLSSEMRKLKRIFSRMKDKGWITRQKLFELREIKCPPKNFTPLIPNPDEDFKKVLTWFYKNDLRSYDFYFFLIRTARRPGKVRELLREHVNLTEEYIFVPKEKHGGESWIPFNDAELRKTVLRAVEFSRKLNSPFLFVNKDGKQFSKSNPLRVFKDAVKACGIPNWKQWTLYQLKKYMISLCYSNNLNSEKIQTVSGHKNLDSVKKHYYQASRIDSKEVFEASKFKVQE